VVAPVVSSAVAHGIVSAGLAANFGDDIMGMLMPCQSQTERLFNTIEGWEGIGKACGFLHDLGIKSDYIKKSAIDKNIVWNADTGDGKRLTVTINLTKPEKDNAEIARLAKLPSSDYPKCVLCFENIGWWGSERLPARQNLRVVPMNLMGEVWFLQFSPYAYYQEHCILINKKHTPMIVEPRTLEILAAFADRFPYYFMGSNAALPIIGGSLLSHEHFQGGAGPMPLHSAGIRERYTDKDCPAASVGIADWHNSVVRIESKDRAALIKCGAKVIETWRKYSDESVNIIAETAAVPHNSSAPIIRKEKGAYILDIILRNNRTSAELPDGIFHAHPQYHNIKKEGIGLIEAMGLFILPPRVLKEIDRLKAEGRSDEQAREYINGVCKNILIDTAVFKPDGKGRAAFAKFMKAAGFARI
jgi:UDPglucose--hexose-1-phosphate uridylyltransferase